MQRRLAAVAQQEQAHLALSHARARHETAQSRLVELQTSADAAAASALECDAKAQTLRDEGSLDAATAQGVLAIQMHSRARSVNEDVASAAIAAEVAAAELADADVAAHNAQSALAIADTDAALLLDVAGSYESLRHAAVEAHALRLASSEAHTAADAAAGEQTASSARAEMLSRRAAALERAGDETGELQGLQADASRSHDASAASEAAATNALSAAAMSDAQLEQISAVLATRAQRLEDQLRLHDSSAVQTACGERTARLAAELAQCRSKCAELQSEYDLAGARVLDAEKRSAAAQEQSARAVAARRGEAAAAANADADKWHALALEEAAQAASLLVELTAASQMQRVMTDQLDHAKAQDAAVDETCSELTNVLGAWTAAADSGATLGQSTTLGQSSVEATSKLRKSLVQDVSAREQVLAALTALHARRADALDADDACGAARKTMAAASEQADAAAANAAASQARSNELFRRAAELRLAGHMDADGALLDARSAAAAAHAANDQVTAAHDALNALQSEVTSAEVAVAEAHAAMHTAQEVLEHLRAHADAAASLCATHDRLSEVTERLTRVKLAAEEGTDTLQVDEASVADAQQELLRLSAAAADAQASVDAAALESDKAMKVCNELDLTHQVACGHSRFDLMVAALQTADPLHSDRLETDSLDLM